MGIGGSLRMHAKRLLWYGEGQQWQQNSKPTNATKQSSSAPRNVQYVERHSGRVKGCSGLEERGLFCLFSEPAGSSGEDVLLC